MENRYISVFYDEMAYPFKDKERSTRFPIVGSAFMNASNTTTIKFYTRDIGGTNRQWVVIGKLANGKRGFQLLTNPTYDSDIGEYYYAFQLSQFFTQCKGDLFLSLGGYNGGDVVLENEVYELDGNPVVETTGTIKVNIAYSTPIDNGEQDIDNLQELLGAFGDKMDTSAGVLALATKTGVNPSDYENGQLAYVEDEDSFYKVVYDSDNDTYSWELQYDLNDYRDKVGIILLNYTDYPNSGVPYDIPVAQRSQFSKPSTIILYGGNMYFKTNYTTYRGALGSTAHVFSMVPDIHGHYDGSARTAVELTMGIIWVRTDGTKFEIRDTNPNNPNLLFYDKTLADSNFPNKNSGKSETIGANWTFSTTPQVSANQGNNGNEVAKKSYVDSQDALIQGYLDAHEANTSNPHSVTKAQVGLGNVDNVKQVPYSEKGVANGVATLDGNAKVPMTQLPDEILNQMARIGTLYILNSNTSAVSYNLATDGVIKVTDDIKAVYGLTTYKQITLNGITIGYDSVPNNFITFSNFVNAVYSHSAQKEIIGDFLIIAGIVASSSIGATDNLVEQTLSQINGSLNAEECSTGDWLIVESIIDSGGTKALNFTKIDNTDAVSSVNGKTGAVVLDKTDIGLGNVDNTSDLNKPISTATQNALNDKIDTTTADDRYQSKIRHADLTTIPSTSWQLVGDIYKYTSEDLYYYLGLVNTNDLAELVGINEIDRQSIADNGIYVENVTTTEGHTYAYLCSKFPPSESLDLSVVVTKQYGAYGHSDDVLTESDFDNESIILTNSKLRVNPLRVIQLIDITDTTTIQDVLDLFGNPTSLTCYVRFRNEVYTAFIRIISQGYALEARFVKGTTYYAPSNTVVTSTTINSIIQSLNANYYFTTHLSTTATADYLVGGTNAGLGVKVSIPTTLYLHKLSFEKNSVTYDIWFVSKSATALTKLGGIAESFNNGNVVSLKYFADGTAGYQLISSRLDSSNNIVFTYLSQDGSALMNTGSLFTQSDVNLSVTDTVTKL